MQHMQTTSTAMIGQTLGKRTPTYRKENDRDATINVSDLSAVYIMPFATIWSR
jgi:hypothetical protein